MEVIPHNQVELLLHLSNFPILSEVPLPLMKMYLSLTCAIPCPFPMRWNCNSLKASANTGVPLCRSLIETFSE